MKAEFEDQPELRLRRPMMLHIYNMCSDYSNENQPFLILQQAAILYCWWIIYDNQLEFSFL